MKKLIIWIALIALAGEAGSQIADSIELPELTTTLLDESDVGAPYIDRYEQVEEEDFHPDDPSGPSEAEHRGEAW